jgi:hypothetical protein
MGEALLAVFDGIKVDRPVGCDEGVEVRGGGGTIGSRLDEVKEEVSFGEVGPVKGVGEAGEGGVGREGETMELEGDLVFFEEDIMEGGIVNKSGEVGVFGVKGLRMSKGKGEEEGENLRKAVHGCKGLN